MTNTTHECMSASDIDRTLIRLAHQIVEAFSGEEQLNLVGIVTRGDLLARRLAKAIHTFSDLPVRIGALDISFYRDDFGFYLNPILRGSDISFPIDNERIILVDDVLFTGRTIRAALDALTDFGRAKSVSLAVLLDRGHRELPIKADFVGKNVPSSLDESVRLYLEECDGISSVQIRSLENGERPGSAPLNIEWKLKHVKDAE